MASIKEIARKINKAWNEDTLVAGDLIPSLPRMSVGSLVADYALYGGICLGSIIVFSGVEHSGKSLCACLAMAQYQKQHPDKCCIYVDVENTLLGQIPFIVKMTGLDVTDPNKFLRYNCYGKSAEDIFTDLCELQEAEDIGMIVIDSAPALISKTDIDSTIEHDVGMRGTISIPLGRFLKRMMHSLARNGNSLIIINQVREAGKNRMGAIIYSEPCGSPLRFYPTIKIRFGTRTFTKGEKYDIPSSRAEDSDGFRIKFSITKSKVGALDRGGGYFTFRYDTGVDKINDSLDIAVKLGYIQRGGANYTLLDPFTKNPLVDEDGNERKFYGKANLLKFLNENLEFSEDYFNQVHQHMNECFHGLNLLDKDDLDEILEQEENIKSYD